MPCSAPRPVPTMMAVGVARPSAQGQEMTRTAVMARMEAVRSPVVRYQPAKARRLKPTTAGTKTWETRSARRWMGALEAWASSTIRMIWARVVPAPTRVASKVKLPAC